MAVSPKPTSRASHQQSALAHDFRFARDPGVIASLSHFHRRGGQ